MEGAVSYARFDEIENVLGSLDLLAILCPILKRRRSRSLWKWIIMGAQDAVQGALVCALANTTGTNVLTKKSGRRILEWLEDTSKEYPGEFMADFKTLLESAKIELSSHDSKDITKLHSFRNNFAHFTPKRWSIELAGLPRIVGAALRLVEELMRSDKVRYRMTGNKLRRLANDVSAIRKSLGISL
jgi:hypothetical protein